MNDLYYRLNEPDASTEDFQTEILAVNLKSGHYHSIRGSAAPIWRLLTTGHSVRSTALLLAPVYKQEAAQFQTSVEAFVVELEKAHLLVASPAPDKPAAENPAWLATLSGDYAAPVLESYTDMQDLLLLDPIHDVEAEGWPKAPGSDDKV